MPRLDYNHSSAEQYPKSTIEYLPSIVNSKPIKAVESDAPTITNSITHKQAIVANEDTYITPRDLFKLALESSSQQVREANINESKFLSILATTIAWLISATTRPWNFLSTELTLELKPGKVWYDLPNNTTEIISVYTDYNNVYFNHEQREITYLDLTETAFATGINYYTKKGNSIKLVNYKYIKEIDKCQGCGHCNFCNTLTGNIHVKYFYSPKAPENMDESMYWLPNTLVHKQLFIEKIKEEIARLAGSAYLSPTADSFLNKVNDMDFRQSKVSNKRNADIKLFDFRKIR